MAASASHKHFCACVEVCVFGKEGEKEICWIWLKSLSQGRVGFFPFLFHPSNCRTQKQGYCYTARPFLSHLLAQLVSEGKRRIYFTFKVDGLVHEWLQTTAGFYWHLSPRVCRRSPSSVPGSAVQNSSPEGGRGSSFPTSSSPLTNKAVIQSRKKFQCKLWACFVPVLFCFDIYKEPEEVPHSMSLWRGRQWAGLLGFKLFQEVKHTSERNAVFSFAFPAIQALHPWSSKRTHCLFDFHLCQVQGKKIL